VPDSKQGAPGLAGWVSASRRAQGFAVKVEDEAALLQAASMILALLAPGGRAQEGGTDAVA
jgi:hypothetical protein